MSDGSQQGKRNRGRKDGPESPIMSTIRQEIQRLGINVDGVSRADLIPFAILCHFKDCTDVRLANQKELEDNTKITKQIAGRQEVIYDYLKPQLEARRDWQETRDLLKRTANAWIYLATTGKGLWALWGLVVVAAGGMVQHYGGWGALLTFIADALS